uniref:Zinc finger protein n=1 Tax=Piliocolobus tephrosceles TaxID=591936 RepID=A0A8C9G9I9_9PRIM
MHNQEHGDNSFPTNYNNNNNSILHYVYNVNKDNTQNQDGSECLNPYGYYQNDNNNYYCSNNSSSTLDHRKNSYISRTNTSMNNNSSINNNNNNNINYNNKDFQTMLSNLNNIEITDTKILLLCTCKLLLRMHNEKGSSNGKDKINMSITSIEILRELKNQNHKKVQLLKINTLNDVLIHLSKKSDKDSGNEKEVQDENKTYNISNDYSVCNYSSKNNNDNENVNKNINATYTVIEKHKEIIVEEPCIYIENVGINIIIKGIYINNMKRLLLKYLYKYYSSNYKQINELTNDDSLRPNDKNHKKCEQIKNKNLITANFSMQDEYNNDYAFMQSGNIHNISNSSNNNNNNNRMYGHPLPPQEESERNKIRNGCNNINDNNYDSYNYNNNSIKHYSVFDYGTKIGTNMNDSMATSATSTVAPPTISATNYNSNINSNNNNNNKVNYLEHLINEPTAKEKKIKQETTNILSIIEAPTVIEEMRIKKFQKQTDSVKIICPHLTKKVCIKHSKTCNKVHFKKIISEHTDISLGDCSYLDTCRHIETCKFVHYAVDKDDQQQLMNGEEEEEEEEDNGDGDDDGEDDDEKKKKKKKKKKNKIFCFNNNNNSNGYAPQWIRCDLRNFDL